MRSSSLIQLLFVPLCGVLLGALASPFDAEMPKRHLLEDDDGNLNTTDKIIIGVTCSAFGIVFIIGGVYAFVNRKKIFSSPPRAKVMDLPAQQLDMEVLNAPGPSASSYPPPEGTATDAPQPTGGSSEEAPPTYNDTREEQTVQAQVETEPDPQEEVNERF